MEFVMHILSLLIRKNRLKKGKRREDEERKILLQIPIFKIRFETLVLHYFKVWYAR